MLQIQTEQPLSEYVISIAPGRSVEAKLMKIPLDKIKLDPKNVRFRHLFMELTDGEMEKRIWGEPTTRNWYAQIKYAQGLSEKPIVQAIKDHYVVREGNVRIVCLRKIKKEILDGEELNIPLEKIDPQPCLVLPKDVSETDISIYLTRIHVNPKTPWAAFNKAGQIYDLYTNHGLTYDDIAKSCNVGKATAIRMVTTYKAVSKYFEKYPGDKRMQVYSYFFEFYKLESKLKKIGLENWPKENLDHFMAWVFKKQFKEGKEVRDIARIITNRDAYQILMNGGTIKKAIEALDDPTTGSEIYKRLGKLMNAFDGFSYEEMVDTAENPKKLLYLKGLRKKIDEVIANIEAIQKTKKKRTE